MAAPEPRPIDPATAASRLRALLGSGFGPGLPRREADRFILLHALASTLGDDETLDERAMTARIAAWLAEHGGRLETDPVTLRRALVDHGFVERDDRGRDYRRSRAHERRVVFTPADAASSPAPPGPGGRAGPPAPAVAGLAAERCAPCRGGDPPLGDDAARALLAALPGWSIERVEGIPRLVRDFVFPDFRSALAFADRVGAAAEAEDHHPELRVAWGRTRVEWWTHAVGGLSRNDFVMAARTSSLSAG